MAIYKIFPSKDSTLYSQYPDKNTGLDSILEIFNKTHNTDPLYISEAEVARALVAFDSEDINDVIVNYISGSTWQANLKLFNANTTGIINNSKLFVYPLAQDWANGLGKSDDSPETEKGVSWDWLDYVSGSAWTTSGYGAYITGSYIASNPGGGSWYTGSISGSKFEVTQSFDTRSEKDLNLVVTDIVNAWQTGSIGNYGFILKWSSSLEFSSSSSLEPNMNLFSVDTHTIYPPQLEFRWNDYSFSTGSNTVGFISSSQMVLSFPNNKGEYQQNSVTKFRINCRPQFPNRTFQTSSFYISNNYLPLSSSYAIKDLDTNEFVVDFDDVYTKISADSEGNYFKVWMSGLEPERYYTILVKTVLNGETQIIDDSYYFKVING
jgi:hypothetical protein